MNNVLQAIQQLVPPPARRLANWLLDAVTRYEGPYGTWQAAQAQSTGYDAQAILARVTNATSRVLRGEAAYEQDGQVFRGAPPPSHALAALMLAATLDGGGLSVIDFGGGLGSHYLRWRTWLEALPSVDWLIIEQPQFVAEGQRLLSDIRTVSFATNAGNRRSNLSAVLASSVLHYLPDPLATLNDVLTLRPKIFILDRTPLSAHDSSQIMVQHVPKSLGRASYPVWILPRIAVYNVLGGAYRMLTEFPAADADIRTGAVRAHHTGSVWLRNDCQ